MNYIRLKKIRLSHYTSPFLTVDGLRAEREDHPELLVPADDAEAECRVAETFAAELVRPLSMSERDRT